MKKLIPILVFMLMAVVTFAALPQQQITFSEEFQGFSLVRTDISWVKVYNAGTDTASTIYKDRAGTAAITQPITASSTNTSLLQNLGLVYFFDRASTHDIEASVGGVIIRINGVKSGITRIDVPQHLALGAVTQKGGYIAFGEQPVCVQEDGTVASGVDTEVNVGAMGGLVFEFNNIGTQTVLVPNIAATGLDVGRTQTNAIGSEFNQGILASSPAAFTIGTDGPFHFRLKFSIATAAGSGECAVGFRNDGAYAPAIDNYTDMAAFNIQAGVINIETILNNAGTVTTDTTLTDWVDAATHILEVDVSMAGVVTYKYDGSEPTVVAAFTFDTGDVVIPFFHLVNNATKTGAVVLQTWECALDK